MGDRAGSIPVIRITKSLEIEVFRGFLYEQIKLEKPMDLLPLASLIYLTVTIYYTINLNTSLLFFSILATITLSVKVNSTFLLNLVLHSHSLCCTILIPPIRSRKRYLCLN